DTGLFQDKIGLYMLVGFSVFFFGIIAYMIWGYAIDLRSGFKYRIEGKITDKELRVHTSTSHSSGGKTSSSSYHHRKSTKINLTLFLEVGNTNEETYVM